MYENLSQTENRYVSLYRKKIKLVYEIDQWNVSK